MKTFTYDETIQDARELALKIPGGRYKAIHPIPAGGIAIGVILAEILELPLLSVEEYKQYSDKKDVLLADDLVDSGETLKRYPESDAAVLYKKPHSPEPTYYLKDIGSEWVIFPHEKDKYGILDHLIRVFSFIDIRLEEKEEQSLLNILNKINNKEYAQSKQAEQKRTEE